MILKIKDFLIKHKTIIFFSLAFIMTLLFIQKTVEIGELQDDYKNQIGALENTTYKYKQEINKKGEEVVTQQQIILTQKQAHDQDILNINELKKELNLKQIDAIIKSHTAIAYDTTHLPYVDTPIVLFIDSQYYLKVPISFSKKDKWRIIEGSVGKDSVVITKDSTNNETTVIIGYSRKWIWGKKHPVVVIKNTNPNIHTTSMANVIVKDEDGWLKRLFKFLIGKR